MAAPDPQQGAGNVSTASLGRSVLTLLMLAGVWVLWSGLTVEWQPESPSHWHVDSLLAVLGLASCIVVVWLCRRLGVLDEEGQPYHLALRVLAYLPWLLKEVVLSNLHVARVILKPSLVRSQLVRSRASQRTVLGQVIHANTITLTPGTITLDLRNGELLVHALTDEAAAADQSKAIDSRISRIEGRQDQH